MKKYLILALVLAMAQTVQSQQKTPPHSTSTKTGTMLSGTEICKLLIRNFERANVPDIVALFDNDAVIRFPFAGSLGAPEVYEGTTAYGNQISRVYTTIKDFKFFNVRITPSLDQNTFWIESEAKGIFVSDKEGGKEEVYEQKYVMKLQIENGKIVDYTEYWNPVPILQHMKKITNEKR